ncbi:hypothetical protein B0H63DRAFT_454704 [Podospora didyma]|uniref:Uncharacterized protein n=1 Tax=Podospora didyma TaxID=330526 RepID=A0AAE0K5N5_9PEZI|nr:hypothetical protein B0H63DRAFT_454704 [Podospora didyma]
MLRQCILLALSVFGTTELPALSLFTRAGPLVSTSGDSGNSVLRSFLVIDKSKGSSYLPVQRSEEALDPDRWDIASIGLYKRQAETEQAKKMEHMILKFESEKYLSEFTNKFKQVHELARIRLARYMARDG